MSPARRALALAALLALSCAAGEAANLKTNRAKTLVPLDEIIPGGPPPDGIPAIDRPEFIRPAEAARWLRPKEPVLGLTINADARAYPLQILMWHEIVNDVVGSVPVAITYCPLCNSALVFERAVEGATLDFGTSGMLYRSDLVMYDRQSHSLWSQMEGRAIVGDRAGVRLKPRPANTIAFEDWQAAHPRGRVLSRETGHHRRYGVNPYEAYDEPMRAPFLFQGRPDPRRPPKERVVGVAIGEARRAYPFFLLEKYGVAHDDVAGQPIVVFYRPGTLSALDATEIARSRPVGATAVFSARLSDCRANGGRGAPRVSRDASEPWPGESEGGVAPFAATTRGAISGPPTCLDRTLTFEATPEGFRDRQTGSRWDFFGAAAGGPLAGQRLTPVPHVDAFWFAWAAFNPTTTLWTGP